MINLLVPRTGDGTVILAKRKENFLGNDPQPTNIFYDVVLIMFVENQNGGMAPMPMHYPSLLIKELVDKDYLNDMEVTFELSNYVVIEEKHIIPEFLEVYKREMTKRGKIPIFNSIPEELIKTGFKNG